ncbi:nuclear transport factor 2 family protein [Hufsiella ginkgonis]|uniref:DUF4440 domain-containing protein n=1 Tax=Hufsiella ginkgonis TaxID=2695274 RepID=A0A7K1XXH8_9SPHI|nr:nuclear transport factor 2 family protein [Hufsiella ginkgonis]MXV15700.1 DUF4440 domain-containing protein [Hufsiella ginkgonis]
MKRLFYFVLLFLAFQVAARAQSKNEKEVTAAVQVLSKAMLDGNRAQLEASASDNLTYGHSSGKMEDKAAFVESLASGKSDFVTLDLTEQTVKVVGSTALVRHKLNARTNDNGVAGTTSLGVLQVWQKEKGTWKLIARQAFKLAAPTP